MRHVALPRSRRDLLPAGPEYSLKRVALTHEDPVALSAEQGRAKALLQLDEVIGHSARQTRPSHHEIAVDG